MLNPSEMARGLRELSPSTHRRLMCEAVDIVDTANVTVNSLYGGNFNFTTNNDYVTHFAAKFTASSRVPNGVCMTLNFASSNYVHRVHLEVEVDETPLAMAKRLWADVKSSLRATPNEGEVAAHFSMVTLLFWLVHPVNSDLVAEYNGKYYIPEQVGGGFYRVHTSETEAKWIHASNVNPSTVVAYQSEYYAAELMVQIYHNSIPFTETRFKMPEWLAREQYQTVLVDNEVRFIDLERPLAAYFKTAIHGYSTRIEKVVPCENLFQKGKADLYANRPVDETPFLGWELEACTDESNVGRNEIAKEFKARMPFLVMAKSDSSISPEGFETVSVPATLDFWKETALSDTLDAMRASPYKMRSFKHSSCGFHVHVSRSALSLLDLQKMERFMHNPANRSALEQVAGRKANTYQNYVDDLFNNRKKLNAPKTSDGMASRIGFDGIDYFIGSTPGGMAEITRQITVSEVLSRYRGYGRDSLFGLLYTYFGDCVSYSHLNRVSGELFNNTSTTGGSMINYAPDQIACIQALCRASPFFRWKFDNFFTCLQDVLPSITYSPEPPAPAAAARDTRGGVARTKLPIGRKNSYRAAMESKFTTGKGMQRYDVLNTKNQNTVEFRLFKGTMNPVTVFRYFEFVDALVRYVATAPANDEGASFDRFIAWVMNDSFNVSRYENLVAFFVETKMYKRESIKRRFLPEIQPEDGDLNVTPKPKAKMEGAADCAPLYSLNTLAAADLPPEQLIINSDDIDFDEDYEPEYDEDGCDCDDCRIARGEDI